MFSPVGRENSFMFKIQEIGSIIAVNMTVQQGLE